MNNLMFCVKLPKLAVKCTGINNMDIILVKAAIYELGTWPGRCGGNGIIKIETAATRATPLNISQ